MRHATFRTGTRDGTPRSCGSQSRTRPLPSDPRIVRGPRCQQNPRLVAYFSRDGACGPRTRDAVEMLLVVQLVVQDVAVWYRCQRRDLYLRIHATGASIACVIMKPLSSRSLQCRLECRLDSSGPGGGVRVVLGLHGNDASISADVIRCSRCGHQHAWSFLRRTIGE